jgi:hypothetical protein
MNTRSVTEHTIFEFVQLLRNWREQRPSNQGDLTRHGGGGKVYYTGVDLLLISFLCRST